MADVFRASLPGPRGGRGLPSGPLGALSIEADHFKTAGGALSATRDLLGIIPKVGAGGFKVDNVASGVGLPREDAAIAVIAAIGHHALQLFYNQNRADECAITFHMPDLFGDPFQYATIFNALITGTDIGFTAFHGEQGAGGPDNTPLVIRMDNAIQALGGSTGTVFWQLGLTLANWLHNFQKTHLQGGVNVGDLDQSFLTSAFKAQIRGFLFAGAADNTSKIITAGATIGESSGKALWQSYNYGTSTPIEGLHVASQHTFSGGAVVPDTAASRNMGSASLPWNNGWIANAWTVTSDARHKKLSADGKPSEAERRWAKRIELCKYQLRASIKNKGEAGARIHWGVFAQQVAEAGEAEGVDVFRHGFLTVDDLFEVVPASISVERPVEEEIEVSPHQVVFEDGAPILVNEPLKRLQTRTRKVELQDHDGKPVMIQERRGSSPILDPKTGLPVAKMVPATIDMDITETVKLSEINGVPVTELRPVIIKRGADKGKQDRIWGIRYEQLSMFLHACARADAEELGQKVSMLEARVADLALLDQRMLAIEARLSA